MSVDNERIFHDFNGNPPASDAALKQLQLAGDALPTGYLQFLKGMNGGEGFIGANIYLILWRAEELIEMNKAYLVNEYAPGLFIFGSDGGGEAFAFDMRSASKTIVSVPFVGMDIDLVKAVADNFDDFLNKLFES